MFAAKWKDSNKGFVLRFLTNYCVKLFLDIFNVNINEIRTWVRWLQNSARKSSTAWLFNLVSKYPNSAPHLSPQINLKTKTQTPHKQKRNKTEKPNKRKHLMFEEYVWMQILTSLRHFWNIKVIFVQSHHLNKQKLLYMSYIPLNITKHL